GRIATKGAGRQRQRASARGPGVVHDGAAPENRRVSAQSAVGHRRRRPTAVTVTVNGAAKDRTRVAAEGAGADVQRHGAVATVGADPTAAGGRVAADGA